MDPITREKVASLRKFRDAVLELPPQGRDGYSVWQLRLLYQDWVGGGGRGGWTIPLSRTDVGIFKDFGSEPRGKHEHVFQLCICCVLVRYFRV